MTVRKLIVVILFFFFFQAEDGIRDLTVTGVQTCALPIYPCSTPSRSASNDARPLTFGSVTVVRSTSMMRAGRARYRSEEHTSELQSQSNLVCRLLLEKKKKKKKKKKITKRKTIKSTRTT